MATFVLGFKDYADNNPQKVGVPLVDEHSLGPDFNAQETSTGVLLFRKLENDVLFIPKVVDHGVMPQDTDIPAIAEPNTVWTGSPNFWAGRAGVPRAIVLHTMAGKLAGADSWFANPDSQVSAHFGVGLNGEMHQYVRLADTAWANGVLEPGERWSAIFGAGNPNPKTVSIETEDLANSAQEVTDRQFAGVLAVATMAKVRFPSITHLVAHRVISPHTRPNCPGDRWIQSGRFASLAGALGLTPLS